MAIEFVPRGQVAIPDLAITAHVALPAAQTAVVVVDMQNDFTKPQGSLMVPMAQQTIPHIQQLLGQARDAGVQITYTQDTAVEHDPEFQIWPRHCIRDTWGWEIIEELAPHDGDMVFWKNRYDGFYGTSLDHFLTRLWGVEHLVIVGTIANICVLHTAASAGLRWYHVVVPADGISASTAFDQALTLHQVASLYNGHVVRTVDDIDFQSERS